MPEVGPLRVGELGPAEGDRPGRGPDELELSRTYGPFLPRFARMALRLGGRAIVARENGRPVGLLLTNPEDRTASLFARVDGAARALWPEAAGLPTYAELDLPAPREEFVVFEGPTEPGRSRRLRHGVRLLSAGDAPEVAQLLREVYGAAPGQWLGIARSEGDVGFVVEVGGRLAGAAWVLVAGERALLHGLTVRPDLRRLGVGSDLLTARLWFAAREGARRAISEIAVGNIASRATAERAGMAAIGHIYLYAPAVPGAGTTPPQLPGPSRPTSA